LTIKFSCSLHARTDIEHALCCIPAEILDSIDILFVCVDSSDARQLVMSSYLGYEIIVISEFVVSRNWRTEDHWGKRYFNFVILHEVAHAVSRHGVSRGAEDQLRQEDEADALALEWLNDYFSSKGMDPFTEEELISSKNRVQAYRLQYLK